MTDARQDESALCVACGLCCGGQLYTWAKLRPDELELADRLSLRVVPDEREPGFALPCSCLDGTRCTVYDVRPQICRDFACSLLQKLRAKEVPLDDALELVRQARELVDEIESQLPRDALKRVWQRINERLDFVDLQRLLAAGEIDADTVMAIVSLDVHLWKHFRLPHEASDAVSENRT
jgi:Fe-S-cluster containining protein